MPSLGRRMVPAARRFLDFLGDHMVDEPLAAPPLSDSDHMRLRDK